MDLYGNHTFREREDAFTKIKAIFLSWIQCIMSDVAMCWDLPLPVKDMYLHVFHSAHLLHSLSGKKGFLIKPVARYSSAQSDGTIVSDSESFSCGRVCHFQSDTRTVNDAKRLRGKLMFLSYTDHLNGVQRSAINP